MTVPFIHFLFSIVKIFEFVFRSAGWQLFRQRNSV